MNANSILKSYQHFGVHLGLERIHQLLEKLDNPHKQVPIIHVAGTNGKGSVCAYLSSVLTAAGYRVGRYTSPHLIDWTERICINQKPISTIALQDCLEKVVRAAEGNTETPTQFEIITAAAWLYFAEQKADIAVIETGLGGRLDATNVCETPLVSVITSISLEHWQILGPTVADIAGEKAGIIKSKCPVVVGELPESARLVVEKRIQELGCPAVWVKPAVDLKDGFAEYYPSPEIGVNSDFSGVKIRYKLPLLGQVQLMNSAIALATLHTLQNLGWQISQSAIANGIAQTQWPGRLQQTTWNNRNILIDGAHNPAAAIALREYVDNLTASPSPINWVIGILATKDCDDILQALLKKGDRLYLVPVPDQNSASPTELAAIAENICPELTLTQAFPDLTTALDAAVTDENLTILCGSLYLVGYFLQQQSQT
ncbi:MULTISPECIES: folylpolyglutamate synthase/dihydrofolate synthase family protein [unclassified Microcoleus]|uniref:bifunctional folylpolyglutamate synthase/dihydrofolate synthase n=1 Tax=unclassified Microcoleus TaxID=2642155 RepID=UPI001D740110|nr:MULTISPECIES: folylpolyglutamate synthase/dihydrofolate synthase family protein [unclassified Microcoleus]MCC3505206.1 bifunctional folylpolyglutamate synthase/dihydrofolate synthase [Microcoleus sp. PH2017_19_SFW_U_A]MCC3525115.1 bifunctional folylpolyglutamate synthase/dihydrofolate synthase [Microcoleus sp. PH2017_20_SFW_D_A]MCC3555929.1 bifunctional folylpolyglutamate synthase/dihydrofolate synthase [Microcoleus sp. PH2017_35_SFW_U_B]TAG92931.1 MAG: bifunctional folylpolyglutamate syntha